MLRIIIIGFISLFFYSCVSMGTIEMEVLKPAKEGIPVNGDISVINQFLKGNKPSKANFENLVEYDKYRLDSLVSVEAVLTVSEALKAGKLLYLNQVDSLGSMSKEPLPAIILKYVDIRSEVEVDPVYDNYSGKYYAALMVKYFVEWEIRDSRGETVKNDIFKDTVWLEGSKYRFETLGDLVSFDKAIDYILEKTAIDFANQYSPSFQKTQRYYYQSGNNQFVEAAYFMNTEDYDKAFQIWKKYLNSRNKTIAGRAHVNVALYYELQGDLTNATKHLVVAKKLGNELALRYLNILEKRQAEVEKLINQTK